LTTYGRLTRKIVPLPGFIDPRSPTSATVNGSVPAA